MKETNGRVSMEGFMMIRASNGLMSGVFCPLPPGRSSGILVGGYSAH